MDSRPELGTVFDEIAIMVRRLSTAGQLNMTAAAVLARLRRKGPQRLTELAICEGVSQPGMTQLVTRLEREGLARRTPDASDRRVVLVEATPEGLDLVERRRAERAAALHELVGALSPADRAAIDAALPALTRLVEIHRES
ncbi:MarR family winged helix-turn-helix transcriptional regulator [Catenuloplanes japonicus]|uniref:MarR family winged helix-turn-helix transcriptional regulator n=1 Tax=Catenuloplanes japonicus TaxID=33876 RepID=UPI000A10E39C|nr:MarR family transcriptional regulator [Catenuloplanes japonicus]